jgi:drug/metabolite transporter (DMT)-like permease
VKATLRIGAILFVGVLAMSSAAIFIRILQADGIPSLVIAAYRLTVATLVLTIPAINQQAWKDYAKLNKSELGILVLSGGILGLHFAAWVTSLTHTSIISSLVLVTTTPIWTSLAAPLILRERTPGLTWIGIMVAIVGGVVIGLANWSGTQSLSFFGDMLALSGAILMAAYLLIGRTVRSRISLVPYLWIVYGTAALVLLVWSLIRGLAVFGYPPHSLVWLIALGLIPQLIGHTAANYAVRHLSTTLVAITILGEPIGSTLLGIWILKEMPDDPRQVIGGVLIMAGIVLASLAERKREPSPT